MHICNTCNNIFSHILIDNEYKNILYFIELVNKFNF